MESKPSRVGGAEDTHGCDLATRQTQLTGD